MIPDARQKSNPRRETVWPHWAVCGFAKLFPPNVESRERFFAATGDTHCECRLSVIP